MSSRKSETQFIRRNIQKIFEFAFEQVDMHADGIMEVRRWWNLCDNNLMPERRLYAKLYVKIMSSKAYFEEKNCELYRYLRSQNKADL